MLESHGGQLGHDGGKGRSHTEPDSTGRAKGEGQGVTGYRRKGSRGEQSGHALADLFNDADDNPTTHGGPILRLPRVESGRNPARKPDLLRNIV